VTAKAGRRHAQVSGRNPTAASSKHLFAAISHDLRTPLAAVVGAASALQTQGDKLGAAEKARLFDSIVSEASHLSTVTENTLKLV
jgi:two-component system sensor histidine kinase KdpD